MIFKSECPIKIVDLSKYQITSDDEYNIKVSRRLTLSEIAEIFGVEPKDVLDGKIGYLILEE